ncbi:MAG TPA: class I SAM-dependent methyltransferase [Phenylobacterium sp.]|jgi:SAM-dependent methyltransferase
MTSPILRKLANFAPAGARRALAGAVVDIKSLPARLADPVRRGEPWSFAHNVGNGDFQVIGVMLLANLKDHAGLRPVDQVLDIGCGNGRVAAQLAPFLSSAGGYFGFDISRRGIGACRRRFAGQPYMRFQHLDVWNGEYNPKGQVAESDTVFPVTDASVDLAFATSVFTHMQMPAVRRYLAEAVRVLKQGGRFAFTAFALERGRETTEALPFQPFDATSWAVDPRYPERAIGHRREVLEAAVAEAGLKIRVFRRGYWVGVGEYDGGQDLFVVVKP